MRFRNSVSIRALQVALVLCLLLASGSAAAFNPSRISREHVQKLCDCNAARFIIIRFTDESGLIVGDRGICADPYLENAGGRGTLGSPSAVVELLTLDGERMEIRRLFRRSAGTIALERQRLAVKANGYIPNLNAYGIIRVPGGGPLEGEELRALLERLNNDPNVAIAYPRPYYENATVIKPDGTRSVLKTSDTPDFEPLQTYRGGPWNYGFNADQVKSWTGALGENVKVIDIEGNWNWDHEDLPVPFAWIFEELTPPGYASHHGTAAVGIIAAQDNGYGVTGFVPNTQVGGVVCPVSWDDSTNWWDASAAIDTAASLLDAGDVYFFPLQAFINWPPGDQDGLPLEYFPANFDAIKAASLAGIICVEPSGNGPFNLDPFFPDFVRDDPDSDCFAIMVGGVVGGDYYPLKNVASHYGERVDVHGWYGPVATTGYGWLYGVAEGLSEDQYYRDNFSGTSSASSVVAGVVASIQSIYIAENGQPLSPIEMRHLLRDSGHYVEGVSDVVGPRPDIAEAFRYMYDTGPPEAIDDLYAWEVKSNRVELGWSAPADDYRSMYVTGYDLRYSESPINESNFGMAIQVSDVMTPGEPGMLQAATVADLDPSTMYYFAITSSDPGGHISAISNVVCVTTSDPGPEIVLDPESVDFGVARINITNQAQVIVGNTGTADLVIDSCQVYQPPGVEFVCVACPTDPIPVGGSGIIHVTGTPLTPAHLLGVLMVQSNDPDNPVKYIALEIDGAELNFSDAIITTVPNGQASGAVHIENPSMVPLDFDLTPRLYCDVSHGQSDYDYLKLAMIVNELAYDLSTLQEDEITDASLEFADILYISGLPETLTTGECQVIADWVQSGGGLFIDCGSSYPAHESLNPLLEQLGLGAPLVFEFSVPTGATTQLADDVLLAGVDSLTLVSVFYKLGGIPVGADWLIRISDSTGTYEKGFKATVGAGRVVVIADNPIQGVSVTDDLEQFVINAFGWLWSSWAEFPVLSGTVEAQTGYNLAVEADAAGLSPGTYAYTGSALFIDTVAYFDVTLHVVAAQISNIAVQYTNPASTDIQWSTNVSLPCRFRYRILHQIPWSSPIMTSAGVSHQVRISTQPAIHYEGLIEVMSGDVVVADSMFHFKTPKWYPYPGVFADKMPEVTYLSQNHPNPFNPATTIRFGLTAPGTVTLRIYDVAGRLIRVLVNEELGIGHHERTWDGTDARGTSVASGMYFYRLTAPSFLQTRKMVILR